DHAHSHRPAPAVAQPVARRACRPAGQQAGPGGTLGSGAVDPGRTAQDPRRDRDQRVVRRRRGTGFRRTGVRAGAMSDQQDLAGLSPELERHVSRFLFERTHLLLLEFDADWHLVNLQGDALRFGFDVDNARTSAQQLQDLFLGMPLDETVDLPFVQMPNGRSAHVHLLLANPGYQVLLLDAQGEYDRQQTQQQTGNEAALIGYQKGKAVAQLRKIRSELEQQRSRLHEANALKNALIATLGHDFRTPLTSLFGYLHLLEKE